MTRHSDRPPTKTDKKVCRDCKLLKPLSEFYKTAASKDGHHHYCIECARVRGHEAYLRKKARQAEQATTPTRPRSIEDDQPVHLQRLHGRKFEQAFKAIVERGC